MLTQEQRDALLAVMDLLDCVCPEQVFDMVEAAGNESGFAVAIATLGAAIANDANARKSL